MRIRIPFFYHNTYFTTKYSHFDCVVYCSRKGTIKCNHLILEKKRYPINQTSLWNLNKRHIEFLNIPLNIKHNGLFETVFDNLSKRDCQFSRPVIFLGDRKDIYNILIRLLRRQVRLLWQNKGVLLYTCVLMDKF